MRTTPGRLRTLSAGDVVGDYRIERLIQRGGMGAVYAAVHPLIGKRVAIKVLHEDLTHDPDIVTRFIQEARAVNCISHPNIIDVFGFGIDPFGRVYLVMELLCGTSLADRMELGPMPIAEVCDVVGEIADALAAVHAHAIVHRDLKPENIFLAKIHGRSVVKLLDFGIAKVTDPANAQPGLTSPGLLLGTPRYIAPEQARGVGIDARADIYSLGVMLFEMLTGRAPFLAEQAVDLLLAHVAMQPPAPSTIAPALPHVADALVGGMLQKDPADRPTLARVRELLDQLRVASTSPVAPQAESWDDTTELVDRMTARTTPLAAARTQPSTVMQLPPRRGLRMLAGAAVFATGLALSLWWSDRASVVQATAAPVLRAPVESSTTMSLASDVEVDEPETVTPMALPEQKQVKRSKTKRVQTVTPVAPKRPRFHQGSGARSVAGRP